MSYDMNWSNAMSRNLRLIWSFYDKFFYKIASRFVLIDQPSGSNKNIICFFVRIVSNSKNFATKSGFRESFNCGSLGLAQSSFYGQFSTNTFSSIWIKKAWWQQLKYILKWSSILNLVFKGLLNSTPLLPSQDSQADRASSEMTLLY